MKKVTLEYCVLGMVLLNVVIWHALSLSAPDNRLMVAFLDVGQGDAIFIESPTGNQILIDGGIGVIAKQALGEVMPYFDTTIDVVLATHPDADHIGGFPALFDSFTIKRVLGNGSVSESADYAAFAAGIRREGLTSYTLRRGDVLHLGGGAYMTVLFPDRDMAEADPNDTSLIIRLEYGDTCFILTGDAPKAVENYLVARDGAFLDCEVLKLGHHGSKTSTSEAFLAAVSPRHAVVSAGCDNRYGHPHPEVIQTVTEFGAQLYSTCEDGTIIFTSDGVSIDIQ